MKKHILIYGLCGGLLIALLKFVEYRFRIGRSPRVSKDSFSKPSNRETKRALPDGRASAPSRGQCTVPMYFFSPASMRNGR